MYTDLESAAVDTKTEKWGFLTLYPLPFLPRQIDTPFHNTHNHNHPPMFSLLFRCLSTLYLPSHLVVMMMTSSMKSFHLFVLDIFHCSHRG